jgi:hypothetical protein
MGGEYGLFDNGAMSVSNYFLFPLIVISSPRSNKVNQTSSYS